ncbi:MAG: hypothetical protein ACTSVZ_07100 [Promethearchaeota archaeon]
MNTPTTQKYPSTALWRKKWLFLIFGISTAIILFDTFVTFIPSFFLWISPFIILFGYGSAFVAQRFAPYSHNFRKHPMCYLSQTEVFGVENHRSRRIVQGFFISWALLYFSLGIILRDYFSVNVYLNVIGIAFYLCALIILLLGVIPINLYRPLHLTLTFILLGLHFIASVFIMTCLIQIRPVYPYIPWIHYIGGFYYLLSSTAYIISYILQKKASLFQNFWVLGIYLGLWAHIASFVGIIAI